MIGSVELLRALPSPRNLFPPRPLLKAVLFDLFETLVTHLDPDWTPPRRSKAERLGLDDDFFEEHWPRLEKRWDAGEFEQYGDALTELYATAGVTPDPQSISELERDYVAYTQRIPFGTPDSAIVEMLEALAATGLELGIVTNANALDTAPWRSFELAGFFDAFVASHEVRLLKPQPEIYELACHQLGVSPGDALFVGDGGSNELRGAADVGLEPLWCSWFLDRWPAGIRPGGYQSGEWRQQAEVVNAPYPRLRAPAELVDLVLERLG